MSECSLSKAVSDVFEENGTAYYVMDYIKGLSLGDMVNKRGPLSEQRAVKYIRQVAEARANWGSTWRLPTASEIDELINKCTWTWTSQGGHNGYKVTGPNGNSIFLPAAGWRNGTSLYSRRRGRRLLECHALRGHCGRRVRPRLLQRLSRQVLGQPQQRAVRAPCVRIKAKRIQSF